MILVKGNAKVDKDARTIELLGGSGSKEEIVEFSGTKAIDLKIKKTDGEINISLPEGKGYYILNAKADTVIGSYQNYSAPSNQRQQRDQNWYRRSLDSLIQLTEAKNISAANRNYFIMPFTAVRITENTDAFIVTPYHQMTSVKKEGNKEPEVYRFWGIAEIRQTIAEKTKDTLNWYQLK